MDGAQTPVGDKKYLRKYWAAHKTVMINMLETTLPIAADLTKYSC